jgi:hypothetical protein
MLKTIDGKDCKVVPSAIENLQEIGETKNTFFSRQEATAHTILHVNIPMCTILAIVMKHFVLIILCLLLAACDGGLAPPPPLELGFSGTVYFTPGSWPPTDSLFSLKIFASQVYPLDSAKVVSGLFQTPNTIFLYPSLSGSLPFFIDSLSYSFPLRSGTYKYIGVIQQTNSDLASHGIRVFRVVGFYKDPTNLSQPGTVEVNESARMKEINIDVDFRNPPPQPF